MLRHNEEYDQPKQALLTLIRETGTGILIPYSKIAATIGYQYPSHQWWYVVNWCRKEMQKTDGWLGRCHPGTAFEFIISGDLSDYSSEYRTKKTLGQANRLRNEQSAAMLNIHKEKDMNRRRLIQARYEESGKYHRATKALRRILRRTDTIPNRKG